MFLRSLVALSLGFLLGVAIVAYYLMAIITATILFTVGIALILLVVPAPLGLACIALGFKLLNP
ncbi:MAG: hypothetical protein ACRDNP_00895 [Gaiellaceae bacterium]